MRRVQITCSQCGIVIASCPLTDLEKNLDLIIGAHGAHYVEHHWDVLEEGRRLLKK